MTGQSRHILNLAIMVVMLLAAVVLPGCNKRPKEIISERKLVKIMADMQLAEAYASAGSHGMSAEKKLELGNEVLAAHGVSRAELDTTMGWYGKNIDRYTELYAKVDKEIISRRKSILNEKYEQEEVRDADMLWTYPRHGVVSSLGNSDGWVVSFMPNGLEKGDRIEWRMHLAKSVSITGVLGVEYEDGSGDASLRTFSSQNNLSLQLQTDTGKTVKRIYGTLSAKDSMLPIFADSIYMQRMPYDSTEYSRISGQKRYGIPAKRKLVKSEPTDTLTIDTVKADKNREITHTPEDREAIMKKNPASASVGNSVRKETRTDKSRKPLVKYKKNI